MKGRASILPKSVFRGVRGRSARVGSIGNAVPLEIGVGSGVWSRAKKRSFARRIKDNDS